MKDPVCLFRTLQIHTNSIEPLSTKRSYKNVSKGDFFAGRKSQPKTSEESNSAMIFSGEKRFPDGLDFQRHVGKTRLTNRVTFKCRQFWSRICFDLALQISIWFVMPYAYVHVFIYTDSMVSLGGGGFMMFCRF